jgi:hypothetical protein
MRRPRLVAEIIPGETDSALRVHAQQLSVAIAVASCG